MKIFKKSASRNSKITGNDFTRAVSKDVNAAVAKIKADFGGSSDLLIDNIEFASDMPLTCKIIYISSMIDSAKHTSLISDLIKLGYNCSTSKTEVPRSSLLQYFSGLSSSVEKHNYEALYFQLLSGNTILLPDGSDEFFSVPTGSDVGRSIEEPTSQTIIRGPKEGFSEKVNSNILLIRKRIKNPSLRLDTLHIGSITKTAVHLMYINKIAKAEIVSEVKSRLNKIEIDGILESGYIEEMIKDDRYSIFPTMLSSEKPDSVAAALLEGKVAILVDGSPFVLTVPAIMFDFLQVSEDYYHHFIVASLIRLVRYTAFFLTLVVPSVYVALSTFHQEVIPTQLLISLAAQREGVPFPALAEAFIMESTFEILREAGIRMPRAIGPAISIVGALVIGQAAVEAGIISAAMVIVVAITAISSFAIPNYEMSNAVRVLRFVLMFFAGALGLYGVFMCMIILVLHLCKIKSLTVPYLYPVAPAIKSGNKDSIFRFPLWDMNSRPDGISNTNSPKAINKETVNPKEKNKPELR